MNAMNGLVPGACIAGVVTCLPSRQVTNDYFSDIFSELEISNAEKMTGVRCRYWVDGESASDLSLAAGRRLLDGLNWLPDSVDGLIYVTQSPDYVLPATSIKLAGALGLRNSILAFDVNLGCSGYPYGIFLAESIIRSGMARRILVVASETASKIIDKSDKSTAMIFGDAGSVTAVEADAAGRSAYVFGADAVGQRHLIIPNSRFCRNELMADERLNDKNPDFIFMDGAEVFNFTLKRVPPLVQQTQALFGDDFDYFLFHQANRFMLNHLVKKMKIESGRALVNIEEYGNTSSASIPLLLTTTFKSLLPATAAGQKIRVGLFGFGVGYSWGGLGKELASDIFLENIMLP